MVTIVLQISTPHHNTISPSHHLNITTNNMFYIHWAFILAYVFIIVSIMLAVLMDNRQPAKTIAWVMVLLFMPIVGIILYVFFGRNTRKMTFISQR